MSARSPTAAGPINTISESWRSTSSSATRIETTYVESVPETADAERVIRQLAAKDYQIIFTTSFGYMEPTLKVAKIVPKVKFEHASGYKSAPNMVALRSAIL